MCRQIKIHSCPLFVFIFLQWRLTEEYNLSIQIIIISNPTICEGVGNIGKSSSYHNISSYLKESKEKILKRTRTVWKVLITGCFFSLLLHLLDEKRKKVKGNKDGEIYSYYQTVNIAKWNFVLFVW